MKTGAYVSGAAHAGVFLWLLVGGLFVARDDFEAVSISDVQIVSEEEFQSLLPRSPQTGEAPSSLEPPSVSQPAPAASAEQPAPAAPEAPAPVEQVQPDVAPEPLSEPVEPQPVPIEPVVEPQQPEEPLGDPGDIVVAEDARPAPRPVPRIAPEAAPAPEPDVQIDEVVQTETAPDAEAPPADEAQEATAPEEATTEVVTEADEPAPSAAPTRSARPGRKPTPPPAPAAQETQVAEEQPSTPGLQDLINDAVNEANDGNAVADNANPGGGNSAPINFGEKTAFIVSVRRCWNVGALSTEAKRVTVTVGFTMTPDAKPERGSIRMVRAEGGSGAAARGAYEAARRAIIRCGASGFDLPADKYDQWRGVEIRFNATTEEIR